MRAKELVENCTDGAVVSFDFGGEFFDDMGKRDALAYIEQYEEREEVPLYAVRVHASDNAVSFTMV